MRLHRALRQGAWVGISLLVFSIAFAAPPDAPRPGEKDDRIRAQFLPRNEVVISSELSAKIATLSLREGDAFRAGQTLVGFDCALFQAQLGKALAAQETSGKTLAVNRRLAELNSVGALESQQAEGRAKEANAEVAFMKATVGKCTISAPFNGRIGKRLVANYQYVTPGTPLLGLIDTSELEVQLIVPSRWLTWMKPGARFTVDVDELGSSVKARVTRIGAKIDPVSQSMTLSGVVEGDISSLRPGMSGWANFPIAR